jgi:hypothetical protein
MTENLSSDPVQTQATAAASTSWRTALQVPLLLIGAAGLGFAGQQMWQNRSDMQGLLGLSAANATTASDCASASTEGCTPTCAAHAEDCCDAMLHAAEAAKEMEAPVSALSPANMVETL